MAREYYQHAEIEKAVQKQWEESGIYTTDLRDSAKEKYYLLFEFPYPSGDLHIGHWYAFALTDIYARKQRMAGKNVLFPVGFDAFGLPAENAAIKHGVNPKEWTYKNMETMRAQMKTMGTSVDWSKEIISCDPSYYKWTQWLFTKFLEQGLAERRLAPVKWCPKDQTVLANEQVKDGLCERCGSEVEDKSLTQWFLKITKYADRLLKDLDGLNWKEEIKDAQRAWIGESKGAKLTFPIHTGEGDIPLYADVFTTRADTVFGATYLVLAPEHPLIDTLVQYVTNVDEIREYQRVTGMKTERERSEHKEKTGVILEGIMATNPATKLEIPVYIADYVLASYGTGAVMAVPAHDERDFAFAQKYKLPMTPVIVPENNIDAVMYRDVYTEKLSDIEFSSMHIKEHGSYTENGNLINSGDFSNRDNREALSDIVAYAGGEMVTNYRLRDWSVGRQRYWGCPIPVVYDPQGNVHAIPAEHLPWLLPEDVDMTPGSAGAGLSPLASSIELNERVTRIFGEGWTPEYDTLDTFVDSSWYFMRYLAHDSDAHFTDQALAKNWMPVDRYSGGSEHTTMHLLYARFFTKVLYDMALSPVSEPFIERFNRGIILGPDGAKMSKSKGNVINPDEVVQKFGADAVRMYLAFIGPYNEAGHYPWSLDGSLAMRKFLDRVYFLFEKLSQDEPDEATEREVARTIVKVTEEVDRFKFNTAISALMVLVRHLETLPHISNRTARQLLQLLAPFAPHLSDHLWSGVGGEGSVHTASWPLVREELLINTEMTIVVQVSGKKRSEIIVSATAEEVAIRAKALEDEVIIRILAGRTPARVIYVPGRLLNIVP